MGGCFPRVWRSASVAPLSSRYSDLPTHKRFSMGRVIAVPVPGRGALSLWTYSAIPAGVTARRSSRLVCAFLIVIFIILLSQQLFFCSKQQCINNKSTVCSNTSGEKTRKAQCFFVAMSERQLNYVAVYVKCDVKTNSINELILGVSMLYSTV